MSQIADHIKSVQNRVEQAAFKAGKNPDAIQLIAVSKTKPVEMIEEAMQAGLTAFGENKVQEARQKFEQSILASDRAITDQ